MNAGRGKDTIVASDLSSTSYQGGPGRDNYFASLGQHERFVVGENHDTLDQFTPGEDLIVIESSGESLDFEALRDLVIQDGRDTVFQLGSRTSLRLLETLFEDLHADDFEFLP